MTKLPATLQKALYPLFRFIYLCAFHFHFSALKRTTAYRGVSRRTKCVPRRTKNPLSSIPAKAFFQKCAACSVRKQFKGSGVLPGKAPHGSKLSFSGNSENGTNLHCLARFCRIFSEFFRLIIKVQNYVHE